MERTRCMHCRNPIKPHQRAVGPTPDEVYHEDCWPAAQDGDTVDIVEAAQPVQAPDAVQAGVAVHALAASGVQQQLDYERRIAAEGLAGVLSPYVKVFPGQRERVVAPVAQLVEQMAAATATAESTVPAEDAEEELAATS